MAKKETEQRDLLPQGAYKVPPELQPFIRALGEFEESFTTTLSAINTASLSTRQTQAKFVKLKEVILQLIKLSQPISGKEEKKRESAKP